MNIQIHLGLAYKPGEGYPFPEKPLHWPSAETNFFEQSKYKKAFTEALRHAAEFEDQRKIKFMVWQGFLAEQKFEFWKIKDGSYKVDLPEHERVEQVFGHGKWNDRMFLGEDQKLPSREYRTIIRFVKENEPDREDYPVTEYAKTMKDSTPIPDQPKGFYPNGVGQNIGYAPDSGQGKQPELVSAMKRTNNDSPMTKTIEYQTGWNKAMEFVEEKIDILMDDIWKTKFVPPYAPKIEVEKSQPSTMAPEKRLKLFLGEVAVHVQRVLRDIGAANKEINDAILSTPIPDWLAEPASPSKEEQGINIS